MSDIDDMMKTQGFNPVDDKKAPVTEQPVEQKPEPQVEEKETVVETPAQETKQEPEKTPSFDFSVYGVKDEEELKSFIEKGRSYESKVGEYESRIKDVDGKSIYYNKLEESLKTIVGNLTEFMSNDEFKTSYAVNQIAGNNKSKSAALRVLSSNLEGMSDLDVLVLQDEFNVPSSVGKTDLIKSAILEDIGVNVKEVEEEKGHRFDISTDLTPEQKFKLERKAAEARSRFSDLKSTVKYPELPDPLKQVAESAKEEEEKALTMKTQWQSEAGRIAESKKLDTLEYYVKNEKGEDVLDFSYKIDSTFKSKIPEMVVKYATSKNLDFTPENVAKIEKMLVDVYEIENRDLIRQAEVKEKVAQLEKKYDDEKHNPRPQNIQENPNPFVKEGTEEGLKQWVSEMLNK